ncbi:helix-turn-helix domain-containing protein [Biformimicrobium ophioploci]|uniref:Helix-turn-helix transcriptional regulator n=1 Tax=Biformimicrobium ophioploci TaxID=3036711 RepID=A0ABQ6LYK0_9GAMM|nr:helix-turn-helix transcriptional regulator [Microbulbifer sp. NKW57]GMG87150.1 helix-turn-helix transcriptional regulator [Microbulbifer sp. NKW57]
MAQAAGIVRALKATLKQHGKTYADVSAVLDISEASVKRLLNRGPLTLDRLERICEFLDIRFSDLVQHADQRRPLLELSEIQEQELANNTPLLLVAVCALNRWSFQEIVSTYAISETECIQLLARLDRMGAIELLPGNRIKVLVDAHFRWRSGGPIRTFFRRHIESEFFQCDFHGPGELMLFQNGMLSREANALMQRKMKKLGEEFEQLHREEKNLPQAEKFGSSLLLAMRPWELSLFTSMRREPIQKQF